jgi:hypothetical protein
LSTLLAGQAPTLAPADPASEATGRLAIMQRSLMSFTIQPTENRVPALRLQPEPIFRFTNPVGTSKDGAIFLWLGESDRPEVAVQVFVRRTDQQWVQEFTSLSPGPLLGQARDGSAWNPEQGGVELKSIPGAPKPADTPEQRLRQMRLLSQDFVAEDYFRNESWHRLRLLAKPLARYGKPGSNLIDGALFSFVLGTDPEVYLMLEARTGNSGPEWQYGCAPMSIYALKAAYKDQGVWSAPHRRSTDRGPDKAFYVRLFQPEE